MLSKIFSSALLASLTFQAVSVNANPVAARDIVTEQQLKNWISTTSAKLTFVGEPIVENPLAKRAQNVMVVYCDKRLNGACGGDCTVYNGQNTCLYAPDTQCIAATADVQFCNGSGCGGSCNSYNSCGTQLEDGFCWTPGTTSLLVPYVFP